jgi:aspartate/methionine/tyrosine aminotransferase
MAERPASRLAGRARRVEPFHVMRLLGRARELEAAGRSIVHLEVGEPDFPTPEPILVAGRAALAAFAPETAAILEQRREIFRQRRDRLLPALRALGFGIPRAPDGAFYLYARLPEWLEMDSMNFATRLLEEAGVALTPGQDFGTHECDRHVRLAYTRDFDVLDEGACRIGEFFADSGSTKKKPQV